MGLLEFMRLIPEFQARSWDGWRTILAKLTPDVREFYAAVGRGAGKSRIVALLACWAATRSYRRVPGEFVYVGIFGPDRKQAGVTFRYICGLLKSVPALEALIVAESKDSLELSNGVIVEVMTSTVAAPRGRSYALAIIEEAAFLATDQSANPDVELLRAIRPALARCPGSLLAVVSSPYARRGILWEAFDRYGANTPPEILLVQAPTLDLNPTFDRTAIERALVEDEASASAEYLAEFRRDIEKFVSLEVLRAVTVPNREDLPPEPETTYYAFCDPSGGASDSMTLCVAHRDARGRGIVDALVEKKAPFSPAVVVDEFVQTLRRYRCATVVGDRFGGLWPREALSKYGAITYRVSDENKSELYQGLLPILTSGTCELPASPRLQAQLLALERKTTRGGRDVISHPPRGMDDLANAVAGALVLATKGARVAVGAARIEWLL